jgi:hypothetical protein
MSDQLKGFVLAFLCFVSLFLGWKFVDEYKYYQVVKREHQEFFLDEIGRTPSGQIITRKQFFDALLAETAKAQQHAKKE